MGSVGEELGLLGRREIEMRAYDMEAPEPDRSPATPLGPIAKLVVAIVLIILAAFLFASCISSMDLWLPGY